MCLYLLVRSKKKSAAKVDVREVEYTAVLHLAGIGFYKADREGRLVFADDFCKEVGRTLGGINENCLDNLFLHFLKYTAGNESDEQMFSSGGKRCFESDFLGIHGEKINLRFCEQRLTGDDESFAGIAGVVQNVSASKKTAQALDLERKLLEIVMSNSTDSISVQDLEGNLFRVNSAFARHAGADSPDSCVGLNIRSCLPPKTVDLVLDDIEQLTISGGTDSFVMSVTDSHGNDCRFDVKHSLYCDQDGKPEGVVGIARNISTDNNSSYTEIISSPSELVDSLSHELRTPLAGMIGSLRVLEGIKLTAEAKDYVNKCLASSLRLKDVVNTFLGDLSGRSKEGAFKSAIADAENDCLQTSGNCEQNFRILLAEDDISSQVLMRRKLEGWGHFVRTACNGVEVLDCIKEQSYDLVLMDIQMPEINGYEAISMIRDNESGTSCVPIVVMSAYGDESDFKKMKELGITDFVSKPIRTEVLKSTLDRIFNSED